MLFLEQTTLALQSPAVSTERSGLSHDPMARNDDGHLVVGASAGDGANCFRRSDRLRDLAIGAGLAERNLLQLAPDLPLKRRSLDVDRYLSIGCRPFDRGGDLAYPAAQRAGRIGDARARRCGVLAFERRFETAGIVAEGDRADAAVGGADEQHAEPCVHDHVIDLHPRAASPVRRRCHAEPRIGVVVTPAPRAVTSPECGATYRLAALKLALETLAPAGAKVLCRRQTERALEGSLQMIRTHPRLLCQQLECDALIPKVVDVRIDVLTSLFDRRVRRFRVIRPAALTGAESGALGSFRRREEGNVVAPRTA